MTELFAELEQLRQERDWSYEALADAIEKETNLRRASDCWRRICLGQTPNPHARTLGILRRFLATTVKPARKSQRRVS